jgi:hypothetical protein
VVPSPFHRLVKPAGGQAITMQTLKSLLWPTFYNTVTDPVPPDVDPKHIVTVLHNHSALITLSPIVTRHNLRNRVPGGGRAHYDVWEVLDLLPFGWWKYEIHFTTAFLDKEDGVVSWIEAPRGFASRAEYTVLHQHVDVEGGTAGKKSRRRKGKERVVTRDESIPLTPGSTERMVLPENSVEDGGDGMGKKEVVLEEKIESSCCVVFRPFVEWTMVPVRRKMHRQVLEKARELAERRGGGSRVGGEDGYGERREW